MKGLNIDDGERKFWIQTYLTPFKNKVKLCNLGKGVAPSPTPRCSSYWKRSLLVALNYSRQLYFLCSFQNSSQSKPNFQSFPPQQYIKGLSPHLYHLVQLSRNWQLSSAVDSLFTLSLYIYIYIYIYIPFFYIHSYICLYICILYIYIYIYIYILYTYISYIYIYIYMYIYILYILPYISYIYIYIYISYIYIF